MPSLSTYSSRSTCLPIYLAPSLYLVARSQASGVYTLYSHRHGLDDPLQVLDRFFWPYFRVCLFITICRTFLSLAVGVPVCPRRTTPLLSVVLRFILPHLSVRFFSLSSRSPEVCAMQIVNGSARSPHFPSQSRSLCGHP